MSLARQCGGLIVGGFSGDEPPASFFGALREGALGGAIVFKRNLTSDVLAIAETNRTLVRAAGSTPPILCVDQEGGRVARLKAPFVTVPPMLRLAEANDDALIELAARAQGTELRALGFSTGFSPVLDASTNPNNPVIGDRAFSADPEIVARLGVRFGLALQASGVFACAKHYPGHGDTSLDSHFALPTVAREAKSIEAVELAPFRAAAKAGFAAMMSAHVVYSAIDPENPATLSHVFCTDYLRNLLRFEGVLFSDDLEMRALSAQMPIEESAVRAISAGCDALLVCSDEALQLRAHEALVKKSEADSTFRTRIEEAATRVTKLRHAYAPTPQGRQELERVIGGDDAKRLTAALTKAGLA
ncbi:MAG: beta-N-acetylhexosaminidase [Polyangiaceae bacterium]